MEQNLVVYEKGRTHLFTEIIKNKDGIDICRYSGETITDIIKMNPKMEIMHIDEALKRITKMEKEMYLSDGWKETTRENWEDMLNVLPPEKWESVLEVEIFRMSEYYTGNITAHYAKLGNKYFTALRRTTDNYAEMALEIKEGACLA